VLLTRQPPVAFAVVHIHDDSLVLDLDELRRWAVLPDYGIGAGVGGQLEQLIEHFPSDEHRMSPATLIGGDHDWGAGLPESRQKSAHRFSRDGGMIHQTEKDCLQTIRDQRSQTRL
jgi:hypothetical protein